MFNEHDTHTHIKKRKNNERVNNVERARFSGVLGTTTYYYYYYYYYDLIRRFVNVMKGCRFFVSNSLSVSLYCKPRVVCVLGGVGVS